VSEAKPLIPDDGGADHLRPGARIASMPLPATSGGDVTLADLSGVTLLIVYPWTGRPGMPNPPHWDDILGAHGSTPELEGFRGLYSAFQELGIGLYGLSRQACAYQQEMATRLRLPFPILSDEDGRFSETLRLPVFETGGTLYLKRITLLLRTGAIEDVFYPISYPERHAEELLRLLKQGAG
jgi:peroxiredoxin